MKVRKSLGRESTKEESTKEGKQALFLESKLTGWESRYSMTGKNPRKCQGKTAWWHRGKEGMDAIHKLI